MATLPNLDGRYQIGKGGVRPSNSIPAPRSRCRGSSSTRSGDTARSLIDDRKSCNTSTANFIVL
jgi:hypothetical protein